MVHIKELFFPNEFLKDECRRKLLELYRKDKNFSSFASRSWGFTIFPVAQNSSRFNATKCYGESIREKFKCYKKMIANKDFIIATQLIQGKICYQALVKRPSNLELYEEFLELCYDALGANGNLSGLEPCVPLSQVMLVCNEEDEQFFQSGLRWLEEKISGYKYPMFITLTLKRSAAVGSFESRLLELNRKSFLEKVRKDKNAVIKGLTLEDVIHIAGLVKRNLKRYVAKKRGKSEKYGCIILCHGMNSKTPHLHIICENPKNYSLNLNEFNDTSQAVNKSLIIELTIEEKIKRLSNFFNKEHNLQRVFSGDVVKYAARNDNCWLAEMILC